MCCNWAAAESDPAPVSAERHREPHDNFAVAEEMRKIVRVWAADTSGEMNKWISDSGTSC